MHQVEEFYRLVQAEKRRKRWRFVALVAVLVLSSVLYANYQRGQFLAAGAEDFIAHVRVEGMIFDTREQTATLQEIAEDPAIKAVIVTIDSPGGTMVGGLELYHALRGVAAQKPVVATMGTTAASAGYLVALAGDHIIANPATLTGSVGVFLPLLDATKLASDVGVTADDIVSGQFKAVTSPLTVRDAQDRQYLQGMVDELNAVFYQYLTERRQVPERVLSLLQDGRALVGTQAQQLGLVDSLGNTETARAWLVEAAEIAAELPVQEIPLYEPEPWYEQAMLGALIRVLPTAWQVQINPLAVWSVLR